MKKLFFYLLFIIVCPFLWIIISTPMGSHEQYIFGILSLALLFIANRSKRKDVSIALVMISILTSSRYLYFRATQTLYFNSQIETVLGWVLFLAEVYSWIMLLLGYLQTSSPLERKIEPLPDDESLWPTVDVYIPTYNENLDVVQDTVLAAQCIDYPKDKIKIYILDDGKRREFAVFAAKVGVGYITRSDNSHAKAGNLNNAMKLTKGELICIFDCDHVATRIFLQATVGSFLKDPKLALIQTPHHYYSPDPFERNLYGERDIPNEGELFYGPLQKGNDMWNATFFCGSCAVIRRTALEEIGGVAVETVTEDAHTALKMQRLGWNSAYLGLKLSGGLSTERMTLHIIQRNRWARGMVQIFRMDNPLLGRGLTLPQRLCYLSAMMYFFFPLPRLIFLTAPLAFLLFNLNIIHSSASLIFAYALPHFVMSTVVSSRLNGSSRYSFWGDIYDLALAFHLVIPTIVTIFAPKRGKFNVTDKGELLDKTYFDHNIVKPHLITACILTVGIGWGIYRMLGYSSLVADTSVVGLNIAWTAYGLFFLIAAIMVARETRQVRKTIRLNVSIPTVLHYSSGMLARTYTKDLSMGGCFVNTPDDRHLTDEIEAIELHLSSGVVAIPVSQLKSKKDSSRLMFGDMSLSSRRELVRIVLSRADAWIDKPRAKDRPLRSLGMIIACMWQVIRSLKSDKKYQTPVNLNQTVASKESL
ncbi:UDP-forming cellulose synthase catalytic subunit [Vibrio nitrifigilis]|uniref:Cellulose synthase catalytic subunit [UDP-forming] n=1 Tax=Vibrio nitrifigilis TaxID=2789781 RepID=A0ABS0GGD6_9VIBR|nr:UDP-forming cellulose synthase catalytic subunit [Vibrio nitrifigilis]MBF9001422.1 UDP-forming cellulose synthase catalytic subunit [Vibrio nitrifigilis]